MQKSSSGKTEIIIQEDSFSVERLEVVGGWLYITRYWTVSCDVPALSVATTFVPAKAAYF